MAQELQQVEIDRCVVTEEFNTRTKGLGDLTDLTASIKAVGIQEPLLGKNKENGKKQIEIYAGFRRLEAAKLAGLKKVPVLVSPRRAVSKQIMLEMNLIENIQRENLNPVDEALGYARLQEDFKMSNEALCAKIGVKKKRIEQRFRLLKLNEVVREALHSGRITIVAALEIDRLPENKQGKYVGIAEELSGTKLQTLINKELDKIQQKIEGTESKEKSEENPAVVVEHIRLIRKAGAVMCQGLGYGEEDSARVKDVNFRVLETDDLGVVARLFDDCASHVEEDIEFKEKAEELLVSTIEGSPKLVLDMDAPVVRSTILRAFAGFARELAVDRSKGKRPKVTEKLVKEVLKTFLSGEDTASDDK